MDPKSNLIPFEKGNQFGTLSKRKPKSDKKTLSFTKFFREICDDPNSKRIFRDKLMELLCSDNPKNVMFALDFIGKRMILSVDAEMESESTAIEVENHTEILSLAEKRIAELQNKLTETN